MENDEGNDGNDNNEGDNTTKLRISFILSPSIRHQTQRDTLTLPSDPIAVPASIRRKGLSAVVNHLLDRKVPTKDDDDDEEDDDEDDDKLPAIPFDFLLNDKLLRLPLDSAVRKEGLSTEHAIELQYFPARVPPQLQGESDELPDWIMSMDCTTHSHDIHGDNGHDNILFTGGADGIVRSFAPSSLSIKGKSVLQPICHVSAHTGPIHCLSSSIIPDHTNNNNSTIVATGSIDQTLVTHIYRPTTSNSTHTSSKKNNTTAKTPPGNQTSLDLHAVYSGGHTNTISSVALMNNANNGTTILASGDWDGGLAIWSVPPINNDSNVDNDAADDDNPSKNKKRKGTSSNTIHHDASGNVSVHEVKPITSIKAHASNISGLAFGYNHASSSSSLASNPTTLLTGSWDHGLKVYDIERMDCILALNGSRVVTSLCRCPNSNIVATSSPDCTIRLWDMRTANDATSSSSGTGSSGGSGMDKSLRQSHKTWVSSVRWSPTDPFVLASSSHDGTLKVWDIRSNLPLHTVKAVNRKGEKVFCMAFGNGIIYSGGSDCVVKHFVC